MPEIGPLPLVDQDPAFWNQSESIYCGSKLIVDRAPISNTSWRDPRRTTAIRTGRTLVRNPGADLDAIPAVRERNIGQVHAESRFGSGFLGQKRLGRDLSHYIVDTKPNAAFFGHFFRIFARNFKPVTHLRTLDMFGSERHFGFCSILRKAAFLLSDIGPKALVNRESPVRGGVESIYCRSKLNGRPHRYRTPRGGIGGSGEGETVCVLVWSVINGLRRRGESALQDRQGEADGASSLVVL